MELLAFFIAFSFSTSNHRLQYWLQVLLTVPTLSHLSFYPNFLSNSKFLLFTLDLLLRFVLAMPFLFTIRFFAFIFFGSIPFLFLLNPGKMGSKPEKDSQFYSASLELAEDFALQFYFSSNHLYSTLCFGLGLILFYLLI